MKIDKFWSYFRGPLAVFISAGFLAWWTGSGWLVVLMAAVSLTLTYLLAQVGHELGHHLAAILLGYSSHFKLWPQAFTEVSFSGVSNRLRLIAVSGPLVGVAVSLSGTLVVRTAGWSEINRGPYLALAASHLVMLMPFYADGQQLFVKKLANKEIKS